MTDNILFEQSRMIDDIFFGQSKSMTDDILLGHSRMTDDILFGQSKSMMMIFCSDSRSR